MVAVLIHLNAQGSIHAQLSIDLGLKVQNGLVICVPQAFILGRFLIVLPKVYDIILFLLWQPLVSSNSITFCNVDQKHQQCIRHKSVSACCTHWSFLQLLFVNLTEVKLPFKMLNPADADQRLWFDGLGSHTLAGSFSAPWKPTPQQTLSNRPAGPPVGHGEFTLSKSGIWMVSTCRNPTLEREGWKIER